MKFRTYGNEKLSEAIQEKLFELGYRWFGGNEVQYTHKPFLYVDSDGDITQDSQEYEDDFNNYDNEEIPLEWFFQLTASEQETITVGDVTFDKEEFESATKHLKPL
jgi:hypothetical protein